MKTLILSKFNGKWILITWVNRNQLDNRLDGGVTFFFRYLFSPKKRHHAIELWDGTVKLTEEYHASK